MGSIATYNFLKLEGQLQVIRSEKKQSLARHRMSSTILRLNKCRSNIGGGSMSIPMEQLHESEHAPPSRTHLELWRFLATSKSAGASGGAAERVAS